MDYELISVIQRTLTNVNELYSEVRELHEKMSGIEQ